MARAHAVDGGLDIAKDGTGKDRRTPRRPGRFASRSPLGSISLERRARLGYLLLGRRDVLAHARRMQRHATRLPTEHG
jgi:hypothetical protein